MLLTGGMGAASFVPVSLIFVVCKGQEEIFAKMHTKIQQMFCPFASF